MTYADDEARAVMEVGAMLTGGAITGATVAHFRKRNRLWGAAKGAFWTITGLLWYGMLRA